MPVTPFDNIPDFAGPDRTDWLSDITISSNQDFGDLVIAPGGALRIARTANVVLTVRSVTVLEGGTFDGGTPNDPITGTFNLVFRDQPFHADDTAQYGNGLIVLGKVMMAGQPMLRTWTRLRIEPKAGDIQLFPLNPVRGWPAGGKLILADTRQGAKDHIETPTINAVSSDGMTINLAAPIQYDHFGAYDSVKAPAYFAGERLGPHVGLLSRNINIKSANANGIRGHCFFTRRADVQIQYSAFKGLGRTTIDLPSATNQKGRYPIHFHHLCGPMNARGYQFIFSGNTVVCPVKPMPYRWGVTLHDSHYGYVTDNVINNWAGAGIMTEEGNESYNVIQNNLVVDVTGWPGARADTRQGQADFGIEGCGIWLRGGNNYVRGNVVANADEHGITIAQIDTGIATIPAWRRADPTIEGQSTTYTINAMLVLEFSGNEVYSSAGGFTVWWIGTVSNKLEPDMPTSFYRNCRAWNVTGQGWYWYQTSENTLDNFAYYGDQAIQAYAGGTLFGVWCSDYHQHNCKIINSHFEGCQVGIATSPFGSGTFTIKDSFIRCSIDIDVMSIAAAGSSPERSDTLPPKSTIIDNVTLLHARSEYGQPDIDIRMHYDQEAGHANLIQRDDVFVYSFNKKAGDDFRVYYMEQSPDFILPQTVGLTLIGSPEAGLTNAENWTKYGIAFAGTVSPTSQTRPGIVGFVGP